MAMSGWIYEKSVDNSARFILGERGEKPLVCIGVNPSTAEPENLDNTLRCVKAWSKRLGFDGWIMLNLYPQRATDPDGLHNKNNLYMDALNGLVIRKFTLSHKSLTVWAAWGTLIEKREYLRGCLFGIVASFNLHTKPNWITIGKRSIAGHPHHPLYLSVKSEVKEFDVCEYLEKLKGR